MGGIKDISSPPCQNMGGIHHSHPPRDLRPCPCAFYTLESLHMIIILSLDHPYFVGVQYHPEYISRPMKPSPPYLGLIYAACGKLSTFLARGCRHTPSSYVNATDEDTDSDSAELCEINSKSSLDSGHA